MDQSTIGSVGHLVGASLETAGHYLQAMLLDSISSGRGIAFAVGLFVLGAVSSIFTFVTQGRANFILVFLIGPAVYFSLTLPRAESIGATWRFGLREYSREKVAISTQEFSNSPTTVSRSPRDQPPPERPAKVSWFFSQYNRITSEIAQSIISVIELISDKGDISFLVKTDRYNALFAPKVRDQGAQYLISGIILPYCASYFSLSREYYAPGVSDLRRSDIEEALKLRGDVPVITTSGQSHVFRWLEERDLLRSDLLKTNERPKSLSCLQLWHIGIDYLKRESVQLITDLSTSNVPEGTTAEEIREQLASKFESTLNNRSGVISRMSDDQRLVFMINEVAVRMFMNEMRSTSPGLLDVNFGEDIPIEQGGSYTTSVQATRDIRRMFKTDEYEEKGDFLMAMLALPYLQGSVLFFLAMTFPLFALACLLPGHHTAIFTWMGLWLWIKLWDVGFAVVMLIDNILYQLLPHGPKMDAQTIDTPWDGIKAALEVDPSYSTYTYYHILAVCLAAVPVLTGFLAKRGGGQIMGLVRNNLTNFSGRVGGSMAAFAQSAAVQSEQRNLLQQSYAAVKHALQTARFDPVVSTAVGKASEAMAEAKALAGKGGAAAPMAQLSAAMAEKHMKIANARIGILASSAYYNTLTSPEGFRVAQEIVGNQLNSHHPQNPVFNGANYLELERAYNYTPVAKASDALLAGGVSFQSFQIRGANSQGAQILNPWLLEMAQNNYNLDYNQLEELVITTQNARPGLLETLENKRTESEAEK